MKKVAVILRVYSRISDAEALLQIIREQWTAYSYTLFVMYNGEEDGHKITSIISDYADKLVKVNTNAGHMLGARELVLTAHELITDEFDYAVFIESDFWLLDDSLIQKYIEGDDFDFASTVWVESRRSLACDFFIVKQSFLAKHRGLLFWHEHPEQYLAAYMQHEHASLKIIEELRPVHVPSLLRALVKDFSFVTSDEGRFRMFFLAKALTHHVEHLPEGIKTKKEIANSLVKELVFQDNNVYPTSFLEKRIQSLAKYIPQSSWFKRFKVWN